MAKQKQNKNMLKIFKDFWQGKVSLVKSFWIWFMIIGSIITIPSFIITDEYIDGLGNLGLILLFLYFLVMYPYLILAYVGTWRSASNYKPKKEQWSWGTIAKIYIALNALRAIYEFFR